jgi:type IV secretion system protein TrbL
MHPLNSVPDQFRLLQEQWLPILWNYANDLFLVLATIEIGLAALLWVVQREGVENIGAGLLRKFLWLGLMFAILFHADTWIPAIFRSFMMAGQHAAGIETLDPGEVFTAGLGIGLKMLWNMAGWGLFLNPIGVISGLIATMLVIFAFGIIAIEMAVTLVKSYILTGAGVFMLGFAAFRGTSSISERYLSFTIGVGLKLFVIYLLVGAGTLLAPMWAEMINETTMLDYKVPFTVAFAALMYAAIAIQIPSLAGALASGSVSLGFTDVLGAAYIASRVQSMAGSAVSTAGAAAAAGASTVGAAMRSGASTARQAGGGVSPGGSPDSETPHASVPRLNRASENVSGQGHGPGSGEGERAKKGDEF